MPGLSYKDHIFISHAGEQTEQAVKLADRLANTGFSNVWVDRNELVAQSNVATIVGALDRCSLFILCYSPKAISSSWVQREANWAAAMGAKLMLVSVEGSFNPNWNVQGKFVNSWNRVDLASSLNAEIKNFEAFGKQLDHTVGRIVNKIKEETTSASNVISKDDWGDVFRKYTGLDGFAFYAQHAVRIEQHLGDTRQLEMLFSDLKTIFGCDGQSLAEMLEQFILVYPVSFYPRLRRWHQFAHQNDVRDLWGGQVWDFCFHMCFLDPNTMIPRLNARIGAARRLSGVLAEEMLVLSGGPSSLPEGL